MKPDLISVEPTKLEPTKKSIQDGLGWPLQKSIVNLRSMLTASKNTGLTHRDNFHCAVIEFNFVHGQPTLIDNPLESTPLFFEPKMAWNNSTGARMTVAGTPWINPAKRKDKKIEITLDFDLRHTLPRLRLLANGQSIANAAAVPVSWPTVSTADPYGIITVASNGAGPTNTRVRFGEAGVYAYTGNIGFNNSAAGTRYVESGIDQNGTLTMYNRPTEDARLPLAAGGTYTNIAGQVVVAAGSYLEIYAFQDSGAVLNLTSNSLTNLSVVRICNDSTPTGMVRGVLWGG